MQASHIHSSLLIARLVGPVFSVVGLGLIVSRETYREIASEFLGNAAMIYGAGIGMMVSGLAILNAHPRWSRDWRSLVTAVGWFLTGIGMFRVFAPNLVSFVGAVGNDTFLNIAAAVALAVGGVLTFKGYVAEPPRADK